MAFKIGDVVWLKSGGARMTIATGTPGQQYVCVWHDQTANGHEAKTAVYQEAMLTSSDPSESTTPKKTMRELLQDDDEPPAPKPTMRELLQDDDGDKD